MNVNATCNRFDYALKNMSSEIVDPLFNATQTSPSIGDAPTTSSSISTKTMRRKVMKIEQLSSKLKFQVT